MPAVPAHHRRTGLCPTLAAPSRQRDGLLLRLPLVGGALTPVQLERLADVSARWGNGVVELTNRANLQLRGFEDAGAAAAVAECAAVGLGRSDAALVTISPFAGSADHRLRDTVVEALAAAALDGLSPKFVVHVDDEAGWTAGRRADVRFRRARGAREGEGTASAEAAPELDVGEVDVEVAGLGATRVCAASVPALVSIVATACAEAGPAARAADVASTVRASAGAAAHRGWRPLPSRPADDDVRVGVHRLPDGTLAAFAAARLGRVAPPTLLALAALAGPPCGPRTGPVRVTAGRAFAIPVRSPAHGAEVLAAAAAAGLLVDDAHPAVGVVCCIGAAGCWQTELDTLARAEQLIVERGGAPAPGRTAHVSGCDKFCASRSPAARTLVGRADGRGFDELGADVLAFDEPGGGEPLRRTERNATAR